MDATFSGIVFTEPTTAETNLALVEQRLPGSLWSALPALLGQLPDPDGALNYLERYLRSAPPRVVSHLERNPAALHYLLLIFSYSHFLSESLLQYPELILWLHRGSPGVGLDRIKPREDLREEFARFAATRSDVPPSVVLARFKRREYLRITLRDVLGLATLAETTLELSHLADVLIERALRTNEQKLTNLYGTPQATEAGERIQTARMTILSLGKLGGQELNYASDIDLMFLYGQDGQTSGGTSGAISNAEYFVRLAQAVLKTITEAKPEGAVFRVDMRLRPEGQQGDLAMSLPGALAYYRSRAREWELQMLIRARVSAGDAEIGRQFLRGVKPLIYRREFNLAAATAVLNARNEITRELRRGAVKKGEHSAAWNVKLSPGGIRDIEFLSQCLQRLHGGTDSWLAARGAGSTLVTLQRLHDKGYLSGRDFFRLAAAYQFLRRVEHRLQLRDGLQRHTLPDSTGGRERLARRCGIEAAGGRNAGDQLVERIREHFSGVREIYDRILLVQLRDGAAPAPTEQRTEESELAAFPLLPQLRSEYPGVAQILAEAGAAHQPHGRRGLQQFLTSAWLDPGLMSQLESHPDWLRRAAEIFARSDLAVEMLARHPEEIRVAAGECAPEQEAATLPGLNFEEAMGALRIAHRKKLLAAVVHGLVGGAQPSETFASLTRIADEALNGAMQIAHEESERSKESAAKKSSPGIESAPFAAIALGRLGTGEMDIGSDADVIFILDEGVSAEEAGGWRRLAERFVHVASSHTREGLLYLVDARLRPRGSEGEIVQSAAYLREYFRREAEGWEAATFLKARPLAGNRELAARAIEQVQVILAERFSGSEGSTRHAGPRLLAQQLAHTRERLEREGARDVGDFEKARGGFYDIQYIVAYLALTRGPLPQAAEGPGHIFGQIGTLESAGHLDGTRAQVLRNAALLYRSLDHAVRLITGRPAQQVPEPALGQRVLPMLRQWRVPVTENLETTVENAKRDVRALYEGILLRDLREE